MADRVGHHVVDALEQAGERFLALDSPEAFGCFLMYVDAAGALRAYDGSEAYWERVQAILDVFFDGAARVDVCAHILRCEALRGAPEVRPFRASALAERRLQELLARSLSLSSNRPE